jgi:RimJ/RimL family protein N-acetyltransferase
MTPEFLRASGARDQRLAEQILGLKIPPDWFEEQALIKMRLEQLQENPALQPWLLKAIRLKEQQQMVGYIGFHTSPGPHYLEQIAPGGIEFGYTIFQAFRRQGYAREASLALMAWAREEHDVSRFILTISPVNAPSIRLAEQLGFKPTGGVHFDEVDGPEHIFERKEE